MILFVCLCEGSICLFCEQGGFYIDPWAAVDKAIITHAHSDHARAGSRYYLCHHLTKPILELRLGNHFYQGIEWGEEIIMNGVKVSLHPAGHIIGSSQVRVEYNGEVWVFSGDYKTEDDGISGAEAGLLCAEAGARLLVEAVEQIDDLLLNQRQQNEAEASYKNESVI